MNNVHLKAIKVELDMNTTQRLWCERACAASRVAYNWGLAEWRRWFRWDKIVQKGKQDRASALLTRWNAKPITYEGKPSAFGISKRLTEAKKTDLAWMHELGNAYVVRESIAALGTAYAAFFRRLKKHNNGDHSECGKSRRGRCSLGMPRFHGRRPDEGFVVNQGSSLQTDSNRLYVPGLGWVKSRQKLPTAKFDSKNGSRPCTCETTNGRHKTDCKGRKGGWVGAKEGEHQVEICGVGIRKWGGRWYAAVRIHQHVKDRPRKQGKTLAVEVGLRYRAVTYDGHGVGAFQDTRKALPSADKQKRNLKRTWAKAIVKLSDDPDLKLLVMGHRKTLERFEEVRNKHKVIEPKEVEQALLLGLLEVKNTHGSEKLLKLERKRQLWERRMSRRFKQGARKQTAGWQEARAKVSKLHRELAQVRNDRIHFTSRAILNSGAEKIIVRDMQVKNLLQRGVREDNTVRNLLAKDVQQAGMAELRRQIEYKTKWAQGVVEVTGPETETKVCYACGNVRDNAPGYPWFCCPKCKASLDRDENAARVRLQKANGSNASGQRTPKGSPRNAGFKPPATGNSMTSGNGQPVLKDPSFTADP